MIDYTVIIYFLNLRINDAIFNVIYFFNSNLINICCHLFFIRNCDYDLLCINFKNNNLVRLNGKIDIYDIESGQSVFSYDCSANGSFIRSIAFVSVFKILNKCQTIVKWIFIVESRWQNGGICTEGKQHLCAQYGNDATQIFYRQKYATMNDYLHYLFIINLFLFIQLFLFIH